MIYTRHFIICPWCGGKTGDQVDHLLDGKLPTKVYWSCKLCGEPYQAELRSPSNIIVTKYDGTGAEHYTRALALLQFDGVAGPVYFVMDRRYHTSDTTQDNEQFFFESHSCPTNWLRDCVAVIEDGDPDPHGLLKHLRTVEVPRDFDDDDAKKLAALFPECFPEGIK